MVHTSYVPYAHLFAEGEIRLSHNSGRDNCVLGVLSSLQRQSFGPLQTKEIDKGLASRQNPTTHNAGARLIASANVIYRTGPSQSQIHEKQGEIIFIREGEGAILVGGKIVGGKPERANEIRGDSIDGGMRYEVAVGDTLYIPVN